MLFSYCPLVFQRLAGVYPFTKLYTFRGVAAYIQRRVTFKAACIPYIKRVVYYHVAIFSAVRFCIPYAVLSLRLSVAQWSPAYLTNAAADCQRVTALRFLCLGHFSTLLRHALI